MAVAARTIARTPGPRAPLVRIPAPALAGAAVITVLAGTLLADRDLGVPAPVAAVGDWLVALPSPTAQLADALTGQSPAGGPTGAGTLTGPLPGGGNTGPVDLTG